MAAMPSPRPMKPRPSIVVALMPTRAASMPRMPATASRMATRCGPTFGASHRNVTSTLEMRPPSGGNARCGIGEEDARGGAAPGRIARREVLADVAVADGAEQRVGEGMQPDVGVGVALEAMRVGDLHAAQPDVIAAREAVHVEAGAVARLAAAAAAGVSSRSASSMSAAVVSLMLRALLATRRTGRPAHSASRGIVGEIDAPGGCGAAVGFEDDIVAERLRCLRPPQPGTVDRARDGAVGRCLFQRVADRFGGDGAGAVSRAAMSSLTRAAVRNGRAASWISTRSGGSPAQRLEAGEDGRLTRGAAGDRRQ